MYFYTLNKMVLSVIGFYIYMLLEVCESMDNVCDRRPLGTKALPLQPDNRFVLDIDGIRANEYIPKSNYTVRLHSRDEVSSFIGFTISLQEDSLPNTANPRKPKYLHPGSLTSNSNLAKSHEYCNNTIIQSDITPKTSVEAKWTAPDKDNKCVTIFAVVAIKPNVWYSFDGPLSKKVCEDPRKDDDMPPMENDRCEVCEDARYELTFQGLWSFNTHLEQYPPSGHAHFSDIVGASHDSESYTLYRIGSEASEGLKMLAEQGNTTGLEIEIEKGLGTNVRTVIKATSPPEPNMAAVAQFRASKGFTRLSIATAIVPSPDWFLGVSNMELCSTKTNQWADSITLNLYPLDAGTDKGTEFNSANEVTLPHQAISVAMIRGKQAKKPFARLVLTLIRTYNTPECAIEDATEQEGEKVDGDDDDSDSGENGGDEGNGENGVNGGNGGDDGDRYSEEPTYVPAYRTTTSEEPPSVDPDSTGGCPMTQWEEWMPCQGECANGTISGFKIRLRYHVVDGIAVGKYVENGPSYEDKVVPHDCLEKEEDSQTEKCTEPCEETQAEEEEEEK